MLHQEFAHALNVVSLGNTHLRTQAWAQVLLCRRDRALAYDKRRDYDGLRFHIACNCRAATPYWGLADFLNGTPTALTTAATLAVCMVKVSYRLLRAVRQPEPEDSLLALQASCRGYQYVDETITMLPQKPEPDLLAQIFTTGARFGHLHAVQPSFVSS